MKKYLTIIMLGVGCMVQPAYSEDATAGMTFEEMLETAKADQIFQKQSRDRIGLLDINSDGIISYNEISNAATGVLKLPDTAISEDQKEELNGYLLEAFEDCDADLNNRLSATEIPEFTQKIQYFLLKQKFDAMDKNQDGVYDIKDMPSIEESQVQIENSLKQMQESMAKLENMNAGEIAQSMIKNIGAAVADEDFYQMDANHDNCVSREEYVNYQLMADSESEEEDNMKMTTMDYSRWYIEIKKAKLDCITKEEYIANQNRPIEEQLEEEISPENERLYAELLFDEIDADSSGKITAEEYAEYNYQHDVRLYAPNEPVMKQEAYYNMFMQIKAPEKGWMDKEEFVNEYMNENVRSKNDGEIENAENDSIEDEENKKKETSKQDKKKEMFGIINTKTEFLTR